MNHAWNLANEDGWASFLACLAQQFFGKAKIQTIMIWADQGEVRDHSSFPPPPPRTPHRGRAMCQIWVHRDQGILSRFTCY